ncbi:phosphodiesterase [Clostridium thermarum]|uniref:phosphodiesterase n=1 Tax=Clostridium thermarum TaxID=1716543 RepID=UPI0013D417EA|nr:phosphodiesterase [Clostridium thermarum]
MKLIFISDIHGSIYFAKKAIEASLVEDADYIVLLGDQLYHGARNPLPKHYNPKEVASLLNSYAHKIIAVRGNCDSEVDQMVLNFPIMADYSNLLYNGRRLFLTHGHKFNIDNIPKLNRGDVLIYGHTHVPLALKKGDIFIINPGSITLPKEDYPNTYGILKDNIFQIKAFDGRTIKEIQFTD